MARFSDEVIERARKSELDDLIPIAVQFGVQADDEAALLALHRAFRAGLERGLVAAGQIVGERRTAPEKARALRQLEAA